MVTCDYCDARLRSLISAGTIFIFYYSPKGQEAIPAGVSAALKSDDYIVTTYRGLHDEIAKGTPLRELLAEYLGRRTGACKGKGGPMHITHPQSGVMVTTGIVGGGLPIANGLALAAQYLGDDRVTICYFGDGASNTGAFHEALTLASIWDLPVVFVCQNNQFAEYTPREVTHKVKSVADLAASYRIRGVTVDGNDPIAVYVEAQKLVSKARRGDGPSLLECVTFRFHGHYFGDTMEYIDSDVLRLARAADPTPRFRSRLIDEFQFGVDEINALEAECRAQVDDALEFAQASPPPDLTEAFTDVTS